MESQLLDAVLKSLGPAAGVFAVMFWWLSAVRKENKELKADAAAARAESIQTLERVLPLVTSVSEVVEANKRDVLRAQQDRQEAILARLEQKLGRLE